MASPSTPPSTDPTLDNSIQHHVHSGLPHPQSVADKRLKTLRRLLKGYSSLSAPTLLEPLSPHFTHEVLPQSLGMPVRGKEDFAHHAAMVFSAFQSFEMKPIELWEDPDRGGVILRCAMEGILKTKEKPEGEKAEGKAEEGGKVGMEAKEEVNPQVDMEDVYNPDGDLSNILGDLTESPEIPETLLSPITEVTEPGSEMPPLSSSSLSNPSTFSQEEEEEPTSSSPPTSLEDAHPSPPSPSPPILEEPSSQREEDPNEETIHWNNECLLIISFTPCGSQISKIQEFVDSAKAVEMKKKHAPKGFDEASAPPPPTYKPATYLDLDTLKLKDGGGGCPGFGVHHHHHHHHYIPHMRHSSVTVTELPPSPVQSLNSSEGENSGVSPAKVTGCDALNRLDRGVQCPMPVDGLNSLDTSDTFSTTTEYPSSNQNSPPRYLVDREAETSGPPSTNDADAEEADRTPKWKRLRFATTKSTSPAGRSEAFNSGSGSASGHVHVSSSGFWSSSDDPAFVDHEHGSDERKGWSDTIGDTIEVINQFVPSRLLPVELDGRTGQVAVKREWVSGAATFVAGVALGKFWFGGGRGCGRVG